MTSRWWFVTLNNIDADILTVDKLYKEWGC